jgi:hypothetical protein
MSITKELRFALDEKGLKTFTPTLVGKTIAYWENDSVLRHGVVTAAVLIRDRYGNPTVEVTLDELPVGTRPASVAATAR